MATIDKSHNLTILVRDGAGSQRPIVHAEVRITERERGALPPVWTGPDGRVIVELPAGHYTVLASAFGLTARPDSDAVNLSGDHSVTVDLPVGFSLTVGTADSGMHDHVEVREGRAIVACLTWNTGLTGAAALQTSLSSSLGDVVRDYRQDRHNGDIKRYHHIDLRGAHGIARLQATLRSASERSESSRESLREDFHAGAMITDEAEASVQPDSQTITGDVNVSMRRTATDPTEDLGLWVVIRKSNEALSFDNYFRFMNHVLCGEPLGEHHEFDAARMVANRNRFIELNSKRFLPFTDSEAYRLLKVATEAFVMVNCGVALSHFEFDRHDLESIVRRVGRPVDLNRLWHKYLTHMNGSSSVTLPYLALIREKLRDAPLKGAIFSAIDGELPQDCFGILRDKLTHPCLIELIWSYWHEEGMLVQSVNSIARRFQNVRAPRGNDPLANLEIDPLRPLNNLFWGYIQDEQHRLSVVRRNYEYDHEYGLRLEGRAVANPRTADSRSKFLEAFHTLLHICSGFYRQDDDTTVIADGFPVLNALKEVHLILSQGAHNQYGEAPTTSRIEMLMQQWMLGRPEFREFLPTRIMVAYPEPWMDRVDAMKKIQGWTDTSVLHFRNLAVFGEQVLLSIRYGAWSTVNDPVQGTNWARFWRPEIQGYVHAYRSVTGVDLTNGSVDATLPSVLLKKRLAAQAAAS
jgi:hypothetical protein